MPISGTDTSHEPGCSRVFCQRERKRLRDEAEADRKADIETGLPPAGKSTRGVPNPTIWDSQEWTSRARALLSEQFGKITFWPVTETAQAHYEARGSVGFFGDEAFVRAGGAGGLDCTTRTMEYCVPLAV